MADFYSSVTGSPDVSPLSKYMQLLDLVGAGGGAYADQAAKNRLIDTQTPGDLKSFLKADYVANGGNQRPDNLSLGLPTYGFGPKPASGSAVTYATSLREEMLKRLREQRDGGGTGEKIGGILALLGAGAATYASGGVAAPLLAPAATYAARQW